MKQPSRRPAPVWRRRLIALAVLLIAGVVVWRLVSGAVEADKHGAGVEHLTIHSEAVGRDLPVAVVLPQDVERGAPLLVFLHGRGGDEDSQLDDSFYSALAGVGDRAPVVAFPNGGDHSYWHDRADGDWATYVADEVIPEVANRYDADPRRVAVGGISMGGFGAYDLAISDPGRFCAVGGHSPALWLSAEETAPGAFDDAEDFARNDVVAAAGSDPQAFTAQPVWLDAGADDPFQPGDQALADQLRAAGSDARIDLTASGGHDSDYWDAHWDEYMRFYADALRDCDR